MPTAEFHVHPDYRMALEQAGLRSARDFFTSPLVKAWRDVGERDNATLDLPESLPLAAHLPRRLFVKRYRASRWSGGQQASTEVHAVRAMHVRGVPSISLGAWGYCASGDSFTASLDLAGYAPADKALQDGQVTFDRILAPTAALAARLHAAGLHHQDLYLCHFFVRPADLDLRLIDVTRVRDLPPLLFRQRWIVKDLAQFWYSTRVHAITDDQRSHWLETYVQAVGKGPSPQRLLPAIQRKADRIARHDHRLIQRQPARNISLPTNASTVADDRGPRA